MPAKASPQTKIIAVVFRNGSLTTSLERLSHLFYGYSNGPFKLALTIEKTHGGHVILLLCRNKHPFDIDQREELLFSGSVCGKRALEGLLRLRNRGFPAEPQPILAAFHFQQRVVHLGGL